MVAKQAHTDKLLREDVTAMLRAYIPLKVQQESPVPVEDLAKDIIVLVRNRVLREVGNYARNNT